MIEDIGRKIDKALSGLLTTTPEQIAMTVFAFFVALLTVLVAYLIIKRIPMAWGYTKDKFADGMRAILDWPRKQKMRREKKEALDHEIAEYLERLFEKKLTQDHCDPGVIQHLRKQYGRVNKKMMPRIDTKMGALARLRKAHKEPVHNIPGDAPPQDVGPEAPATKFGWLTKFGRPKAATA